MPRPDAGDVIIVHTAKVQDRNGISLITNRQTTIHVYSAVQLPRAPASGRDALQPPCGLIKWKPDAQVHDYVPWLYHATNKLRIPERDEFRARVEESLNIKEKFCTLQNVREGKFCDLIVQVIKDPWDEEDKVTMWITDYTENPNFLLRSWDGGNTSGGGEYDRDIYTAVNGLSREWPGPFGQRSMHISCWDPHAQYIRENVKAGDWVRLLNVHIRFGRNGSNLEGFLHEDRNGGRIQVEVFRTADLDNLDDRLKDAIRRKRTYEKNKKKQQQSYEANEEASGAGVKRKAGNEEPVAMNARTRRAIQREGLEKKHQENLKRKEEIIGLNKHSRLNSFLYWILVLSYLFVSLIHFFTFFSPQILVKTCTLTERTIEPVKCESDDQPVTPVSAIVEPMSWKTTVEGQQVMLELPFVCAKYRANVRVVDFRPRRLENFAAWRRVTEYDALSDYSGSSGSDSDSAESGAESDLSDASDGGADRPKTRRGQKTWEWRFALLLEGIDDKGKPDGRLWAVVDNNEAQQLFNLDACE